jgi:antitoxin component YwqK of YwqJK toxin-antitoxin module
MQRIVLIVILFISSFANGQKIEFKDSNDEYDITNEMMQLCIHLKFYVEIIANKNLYIDKVENGIIYFEVAKYTQEEKDLINLEIDSWVNFSNISTDKRTEDLTYNIGVDTDWDDLHSVSENLEDVSEFTSPVEDQFAHHPNCEDIEAFQTCDLGLFPENYSGVIKCCKNGKVAHIWNLKNGKLNGKEIIYDVNTMRVQGYILDDSTVTEKNYTNGLLDGPQKKWLSMSNGNVGGEVERKRIQLYEYNYVNGKLNNLQKEWDESGQLKYEKNYSEDKLNGLQREWYNNGQLKYERNYFNNKLDGLQREYYENGQLNNEEKYKQGKLNGTQRSWYENGQLKYEKNYTNEKLDGLHSEWYENGLLNYEENYKDGKLDGLYRYWDSEGQILYSYYYIGGNKEGLQKEWFSNGQLHKEYTIYKGDIINEKCWDPDGNLMQCTH